MKATHEQKRWKRNQMLAAAFQDPTICSADQGLRFHRQGRKGGIFVDRGMLLEIRDPEVNFHYSRLDFKMARRLTFCSTVDATSSVNRRAFFKT